MESLKFSKIGKLVANFWLLKALNIAVKFLFPAVESASSTALTPDSPTAPLRSKYVSLSSWQVMRPLFPPKDKLQECRHFIDTGPQNYILLSRYLPFTRREMRYSMALFLLLTIFKGSNNRMFGLMKVGTNSIYLWEMGTWICVRKIGVFRELRSETSTRK